MTALDGPAAFTQDAGQEDARLWTRGEPAHELLGPRQLRSSAG